jgi:putative addiction module component (TIGR02574 family)
MNTRADHVLLEALAFAPEERSLVALSLIDSLQGDGAPEDEIAKAWLAEARKRSDDMKAGRATAVPLDEFRSWFNAL